MKLQAMKRSLKAIYPILFFILVIVVPFDEYVRALPNIILIILAISFPFIIKKSDFNKLNSLPVWLFIGFITFLLLNSFFSQHFDQNLSVIKKILLSICIIILYLPIDDFKKIDQAIIISTLIAIVFSVYHIGILIYDTGVFEFGNNSNPLDTLLIDRLYIGLLSIMSILVSFKGLLKHSHKHNYYYWGNIVLNVLFVFLIVSRIAIITLIALVILRLLYGKIKTWKIGATILGVIFVFAIAYNFNDNIEKRFLFTTSDNANQSLMHKIMLWEPRTKIWDCAYIIAQTESSFLKGIGFKETNKQLVSCYEWNIENVERKDYFLLQKFNTHNQFIDFYLSTGILSVLLFICFFIAVFIKNRKNYFSTALLLSIVLFAFVENFYHRQIGAYYVGLIFILLLFNSSIIAQQTKTEDIEKG